MNEADRLRAKGVAARKASITRLPIDAFTVVTRGPLAHPRRHLPVDPELREYTRQHGVPGVFKAREQGAPDGGTLFELIDGVRRRTSGLDVQEQLQREAPRKPPLTWDRDDPRDLGRLYVDVELVACSDAELLLERLAANRGGLPDTPSVLAAIVKGLLLLKCDDYAEIARHMPRGIGPKDVAALGRWGNLTDEARERFDGGAPVGLLAAVLDAPRDEQVATLDRLLARGVRTTKGATRQANRARTERDPWARRMSPRELLRVADSLPELKGRGFEAGVREGLDQGLRLAAHQDVVGVLDLLPPALRAAIAEARTRR